MKNKHLLLLFVLVLLIGLIGKWFPIGSFKGPLGLYRTGVFETEKIIIAQEDSLVLYLADSVWNLQTALLVDQLVQDSLVGALLITLADLKAMELLATRRPDTLGFVLNHNHFIELHSPLMPRPEQIFIGKTVDRFGKRMTWVKINDHDQFYLVDADLEPFLKRNWTQNTRVIELNLDTSGLEQVCFIRNTDTIITDLTPGKDLAGLVSKVELKRFFQQAILAEFADPVGHRETIWGEMVFSYQDSLVLPLRFRLFYLNTPELPDDPEKRRYFRPFKAQFLIESGVQSGQYFSITDTLAIKRLFYAHKK